MITNILKAQKEELTYHEKAAILESKGKFKKAFKYYDKAARTSNDHQYYIDAAEAYQIYYGGTGKKNLDKIMWYYNKSLSIKSWNAEALLSRAYYFSFITQYKWALDDLDSLIKREPKNVTAFERKADIYMMRKDTTTAFKIYDEILSKVDSLTKAKILFEKGAVCYVFKFWAAAARSLEDGMKIRGIKETNMHYIHLLSSAYLHIGDNSKACIYYQLCDSKEKQLMNSKERSELEKICK